MIEGLPTIVHDDRYWILNFLGIIPCYCIDSAVCIENRLEKSLDLVWRGKSDDNVS